MLFFCFSIISIQSKIIQCSMKKKSYHIISNIVIALVLVSLFMFTTNISSNYVFSYSNPEVIYNGNEDSNKVSLMINIYWGNEYIEPMLDVLDEYGVKTTFFVGGSWASKYPDMLKEIVSRGHEIGNHGYYHKDQDKLSYDQNYTEIYMCHQVVKNLTNIDMTLFAPPSGAFNKSTLEASNNLGYQTIMWSLDTIDWRDKDDSLIFTRATQKVKGGSLILCHPTEHTLKALPKILSYYQNNGFKAVSVSENLKID